MKVLPRSSLSTTFVSTRLAVGKRRDSSAGLAAAAFFTETEVEGFGSSPQEDSSAARVVSKASGMRMDRPYLAWNGNETVLLDRCSVTRSKVSTSKALPMRLPARSSSDVSATRLYAPVFQGSTGTKRHS